MKDIKMTLLPFDFKSAMKIQNKEIEGRIVWTGEGMNYIHTDVYIVDRDFNTHRHRLNEGFVCIIKYEYPDMVNCRMIRNDKIKVLYNIGSRVNPSYAPCTHFSTKKPFVSTLGLYVPAKYYKPYDKVLMLIKKEGWTPTYFAYCDDEGVFHGEHIKSVCCIPYEGNEDLIGTFNPAKVF